jgi:hypothetical protein
MISISSRQAQQIPPASQAEGGARQGVIGAAPLFHFLLKKINQNHVLILVKK